MQNVSREKVAAAILCLMPFVAGGLGAASPLRQFSGHLFIGIAVFAIFVVTAWYAGLNKVRSKDDRLRSFAVSGCFFIIPWSLIGLLWTGLGTPWEAIPADNVMRYLVLAVSSVAVTIGFFCLYRETAGSGGKSASALMLPIAFLAGASYLTWNCFQAGAWLIRSSRGDVSSALADMNILMDVQLYFATILTYIASAAAAASMSNSGLLSRRSAMAYFSISAAAILLLLLRGIPFPNPNAGVAPWYETPAFIVGIPAFPWLLTFMIGVVLLRKPEHGSGQEA